MKVTQIIRCYSSSANRNLERKAPCNTIPLRKHNCILLVPVDYAQIVSKKSGEIYTQLMSEFIEARQATTLASGKILCNIISQEKESK